MTRCELVDIDDASPKVREQYEAFLRSSGGYAVPNWLKCFGHSDSLTKAYWEHVRGVLLKGELPYIFKELVIFIVSVTNGSAYCSAAHAHSILSTSRALSFSDLISLAHNLDSVQLPATVHAALKFAQKMARDPNSITDADFDSLASAGIAKEQTAELLAVIALAVMFNNITIAMRLPLDEEYRQVLPLSETMATESQNSYTAGR